MLLFLQFILNVCFCSDSAFRRQMEKPLLRVFLLLLKNIFKYLRWSSCPESWWLKPLIIYLYILTKILVLAVWLSSELASTYKVIKVKLSETFQCQFLWKYYPHITFSLCHIRSFKKESKKITYPYILYLAYLCLIRWWS